MCFLLCIFSFVYVSHLNASETDETTPVQFGHTQPCFLNNFITPDQMHRGYPLSPLQDSVYSEQMHK